MNSLIHSEDLFRQRVSFKGIDLPGKMLMTDIDGALEIAGKLWVFIELKLAGAIVPEGQRLFIERTVEAIGRNEGIEAWGLVAEHWSRTDNDIVAGECFVREYCHNGQWHNARNSWTVNRAITYLYEKNFPF